MDVIKRDGRLQELDVTKIKTSILNSSLDSNRIINESDLKILTNGVVRKLNNLRGDAGTTSSYEILAIVISTLKSEGFKEIACAYLDYVKDW